MSRKLQIALVSAALYLFVSGWFVANLEVRPELRAVAQSPQFLRVQPLVSSFFVVGLALPSFVALCKWLGLQRGLLIIAVLGAFAIIIETVGLNTGLPYGHFEYGPQIGGLLPGGVPWTVPFAWSPLVLGAAYLIRRHANDLRAFAVRGALWLVAFDLVLDPGAVAQQFWRYPEGGAFYGVPASNFAGWLFSGIVGLTLLWKLANVAHKETHTPEMPRALLVSVWLILVFWTSVVLWRGLLAPTIVGVFLWAFLGRALFAARSDKREPVETSNRP